jgi:hypothetical protein
VERIDDNRVLGEQYKTDFGAEELLGDLKQLIRSAVRLSTGPSGPNPYNKKKEEEEEIKNNNKTENKNN